MKPPETPVALPATPDALLTALVHGDREPVFAEPWQAHAFAITLQLHERGLFDWSEWSALLSGEIQSAQTTGSPADEEAGLHYYRHWLNALEKLVVAKRIGTQHQIHALEQAWAAAAERTPHGQPIVLENPGSLSFQ